MSNNREFIRTTSLKDVRPARIRNSDAVDTYHATIAGLQKTCGNEAASLFAEPVRPSKADPSNPQITWYTPLDGQLLDVTTLDEVARRPIMSLFRRRIDQLKPALADPDLGPIVASWLNICSASDLVCVGGEPVLINWGFLPEDVASSGIRREAHFAETIGRHVPDLQRPPFSAEEVAAYGDRVRNNPPAPAPLIAASTIATSEAQPTPFIKPAVGMGLRAPLIANAVAAILLGFFLFSRILVWPNQDDHVPELGDSTPLQELAQRADALEALAKQRVCNPPDGQLPSLTPLPAPTSPPANPSRTELSPPDGAAPQPPDRVVGDLAESVVMVIGKSDDGHSKLGSGFFVTGDTIVTNRHVVDGLTPNSIQVTNKALGQPLTAKLVATSPPANPPDSSDAPDFALLKVIGPRKYLTIGPSPQNASNIIAAGYPASAMKNDASFLDFVNGNGQTGPISVHQSGRILQRRDTDAAKFLIHTASLDAGSAGGPLVDFCGRVVGINTKVRNEGDPPTTPDQAQDASDLRVFLEKNGVTPRVDDVPRPCTPRVGATEPPSTSTPVPKAYK